VLGEASAPVVSLAEQARILELTHDTVIIRDANDVILYWNEGAEKLYGFTRDEALGRRCDHLLQCDFPSSEVRDAFLGTGRWSGEMTRVRRDGTRISLSSRWLQRYDPDGQVVGVMETSADLTQHLRSEDERERVERRYSAIFHAAGFATWESDWSQIRRFLIDRAPADTEDLRGWLADHPEIVREAAGKAVIQEVNQAAISLFEANGPDDLVGTSIIGRYPAGAEEGFIGILAGLVEGADVLEAEARLSTLGGRPLDVVLRATLVPDGEPWSRLLVMAFDETERKEARAKLEQSAAELAHASRISVLGQLAASIAHEVNQPLTAILTYGKSGRRWLSREIPDIAEATQCFEQIVSNATRAADVIARVRALARKSMPQTESIPLVELIEEAMSLVRREADASDVVMTSVIDPSLCSVKGDRVQVQQVLVNLLVNAIQAMQDVDGRARALHVSAGSTADAMVRIGVEDSGSGIGGGDPARIFAPFFTTKDEGMGMGLSISRSIIEAQGGRITAANNPLHGATIAFTLPIGEESTPHTSVL
jgi:PAS domain S-box-containing protein